MIHFAEGSVNGNDEWMSNVRMNLGDYFTGGEGSVMLIDEFELLYE